MELKCRICCELDDVDNLEYVKIGNRHDKFPTFYHEDCLKRVLMTPKIFENSEIECAMQIAEKIQEERRERAGLVLKAKKKYKQLFSE